MGNAIGDLLLYDPVLAERELWATSSTDDPDSETSASCRLEVAVVDGFELSPTIKVTSCGIVADSLAKMAVGSVVNDDAAFFYLEDKTS